MRSRFIRYTDYTSILDLLEVTKRSVKHEQGSAPVRPPDWLAQTSYTSTGLYHLRWRDQQVTQSMHIVRVRTGAFHRDDDG